MTLLISHLTVALPRAGRMQPVLEDFSLAIGAGEMVALVGESGSGKTTAALAIPRLLPRGARIDGSIVLEGQELGALTPAGLRRVRGTRIGMVFQDALAAFNPVLSVGAQIAGPMHVHLGLSRGAAWRRAVALLDEVGIPDAAARARDAPHQFSGGMRQRAMIAAALVCDPALLIADEPTAGLDPVLTERVLALIAGLRRSRRLAVLLISHDLRLVARHADRVAVLYAGRCVEQGDAADVLSAPLHRYTRALLGALPELGGGAPEPIPGSLPEPEAWPPGCRFRPRCGYAQPACSAAAPLLPPDAHAAACLFPGVGPVPRRGDGPPPPPVGDAILCVQDLRVSYGGGLFGAPRLLALEGISFSLGAGERLALVGASGAGKTTLKRALLGMVAHEGSIAFAGGVTRRRLQPVFQNPAASLDPSQTVGAAITEALVLAGRKSDEVPGLLAQVGLAASLAERLPATLSGGQAQRVAIARALAADPALLLLDEPTASLDAATAAALLALLRDLASRRGLGYIVITHDLAMAAVLAHRVAVLEEGRVVEIAETATILRAPRHAATRALVAASWLAAP